jgi:GT2 family glycosyltransferase
MSLIAVAVFDTIENNRTWMTKETLLSLQRTVDLNKHRLFIIDNASCQATKDLLTEFKSLMPFTLITNEENVGTARAINQAWKQRGPEEHCLKQDNDCTHHQIGWLDLLEEAIERDPERIGQAACKRKDLEERPNHPHEFYRSDLIMLPHERGQRWLVAEFVQHCLGTCVLHNYRLIDKIGYLHQNGIYALDDSNMSLRSHLAGFFSMFLVGIEIEHIDPGNLPYQRQKEEYAGKQMEQYQKDNEGYRNGTKNLYHEAI